MAAELDRLDANDATSQATYAGKLPAWHNKGYVGEIKDVNDALEKCGATFDVETRKIFAQSKRQVPGSYAPGVEPDTYNVYDECKGFRAIVRTDRNVTLGVATDDYTVLQNRDAFAVLSPLVDSGVAEVATAGVLREGRDVWLAVRFNLETASPELAAAFDADGVKPYAVVSNNHAGKRRALVYTTGVRIVCANTFAMSLADALNGVAAVHRANVNSKLVEGAQNLFAHIVARFDKMAREFRALHAFALDEEMFRTLVLDVALPIPAELDKAGLDKRQETRRDKLASARARVSDLWTNGDGHTGDGSAWEAYNGLIQSIDHDADIWRARSAETRTAAILGGGRLDAIKRNVLNSLLDNPECAAIRSRHLLADTEDYAYAAGG